MTGLKSILLGVFAALGTGFVTAQQTEISKTIHFSSINNIGSLKGQTGTALQLETVNGIEMQSCFAGLGLGLDYYRFRSIPLFIQLRKEFGKKESKVFIYGDGGINFAWALAKEKMRYVINDEVKNGWFGEMGLGYKFSFNAHNALLITAAFSFKKIVETNQIFEGNALEPNAYQSRFDYSLNRIAFKLGWEL